MDSKEIDWLGKLMNFITLINGKWIFNWDQ